MRHPTNMRFALRVMLLIGGLAIMAGATLDWTGVSYSSGVDRRIAFAAGAIAVVLAGLAFRRRLWPLIIGAVPELVTLDMAVVNIQDVADHRYEYAKLPNAQVGVELVVLLLGAGLVLLASLLTFLMRRALPGSSAERTA